MRKSEGMIISELVISKMTVKLNHFPEGIIFCEQNKTWNHHLSPGHLSLFALAWVSQNNIC